MIYRLEIENFFSFGERQVLDLSIPQTVPDDFERFDPIFKGAKTRSPKIVALFGPNGSGKSTVLKALAFLAWFARDSFAHRTTWLICQTFNDVASFNRPIRLAIEFGGVMDLVNAAGQAMQDESVDPDGVFRYELEFSAESSLANGVLKESLRQKPQSEGRWRRVFERDSNGKIRGSKQFSLTRFAQVIDKVRKDASVISTLAQFNHRPSQIMVEIANSVTGNILHDKYEIVDKDVFRQFADQPDLIEKLNADLQRIDVGIKEASVSQTSSGPTLMFDHEGHDVATSWSNESHGTRTFISVFPWITFALASGGIAILDELDVSIHPLVLPEILRWFYSKERNPHGAQLWMSCHAVSLLEDLTREEIVLCEKNRRGRSAMYSLADVRPALRRDNFYRKYMGGEYGAVPRIG